MSAAAARVRRWSRAAVAVARRRPVTVGYLLLLVVGRLVLGLLRPDLDASVEQAVSTNLDNLVTHPAFVLLASALLVSGSALATLIGVGLCLGLVEHRIGGLRAIGVFLCGHIGATLLTVPVIMVGLAHGWYGPDIRQAMDYGASYGMLASAGAATAFVSRRWRPVWTLAVLAYPLKDVEWRAQPPDFGVFGHMFGALIGLAIAGAVTARRRRLARTGPPTAGRLAHGLAAGLRSAWSWPTAIWNRVAVLFAARTRRAAGAALAGAGVLALAGVALLPDLGAADLPGGVPAATASPTAAPTVAPTASRPADGRRTGHHRRHRRPMGWPLTVTPWRDPARASGGAPTPRPGAPA